MCSSNKMLIAVGLVTAQLHMNANIYLWSENLLIVSDSMWSELYYTNVIIASPLYYVYTRWDSLVQMYVVC